MLTRAEAPRKPVQGARTGLETDESSYVGGGVFGNDDYLEPALTFEPAEEGPSHYHSPTTDHRSTFLPYQQQQHRRQQTAPDLSRLRINTSSQPSSRRHSRHSSEMALTGDGRSRRRQDNSNGMFVGWLGGTSTPPSQEDASPETTPKSKQEIANMDSTTPKSTSITQSRFGFLSALTTRLTSQSPVTPLSEEEILNLNVEAALYPSMSPSERDTFSPAAYKNLQINATGLVLKMQSAYRERTTAFQEIQAERSVEKEEAEEINMRVESLKMQLEHMASKAAEQEQAMQQLMRELKAEKKARIEERLTREKLLAEGPIVNEDLGVDEAERQKWRKSGLTVKSDVSFDTDEESAESESVFSRSRSPTIMTSARESTIDLPTVQPGKTASMEATPKSKTAKEMTTFQKLFKGISGDTTKDDGGLGADGCKNCRGRDSSVAWDTVSLLRDENRGLKHRVADLEVAVDGALDVVNGIGL